MTITGYDACVRCGLCLPACPTYLETRTETSGPRGRISLIKAVDEGHLDLLSPGFIEQMSQCLDCRACEAICPSGVPYGSMLEEMRARIEVAGAPERPPGQARLRRFLVQRLFADLRIMRSVAALVRFAQQTGLQWFGRFLGVRNLIEKAPRIPAHFFVPSNQIVAARNPAGKAFLHAGCVMQVLFASVHEASMRMLLRARLSVTVTADQGCCGAIALHAGEPAFARELAKRNIAAFERSGADVYVVNAAGCGSTLKEYGRLFADDPLWRERAERFSSRVRDITEVLDAMDLGAPARAIDATVTYQEPCHLVHAQRVSAAPRRLLARVPGLTLAEMSESAVCCGGAGTYTITEPEMSRRLQVRKVSRIEETRATIVATANPGCAIQVGAGLRDAGSTSEVLHVVEILDRAYRDG